MKNNPKLGLFVSLIVLVGLPAIFLITSLLTGQWKYFLYSLIPAFFAGLTGILISVQSKRVGNNQ